MPAFNPEKPDRVGYISDWNNLHKRIQAVEAAAVKLSSVASSAVVVQAPVQNVTGGSVDLSGLGSAAYKNVPAGGGNAAPGEVALGSDSRLSDARVPLPEYNLRVVNIPIDGGGAVIAAGHVLDLYFPYPLTIEEWTLASPLVGSISLDLWASNYGGYPPVIGGSIVAATPPAMTTAKTAQSSTLTGWTPLIPAGTFISVVVTSAATVQQCLLSLKCLAG